jgi:hypothetical protein
MKFAAFAFLSLFWTFCLWAGLRHWKPPVRSSAGTVAQAQAIPTAESPVYYRITKQKSGTEVGIDCPDGGDPTVVGNFDGMLMISCGE